MREIREHEAYELLKNKYERVYLDYVIMSTDMNYEGLETHKKAVIEAFDILNARNEYLHIEYEPGMMRAVPIGMDEFLETPQDDYYDNRSKKNRTIPVYDPIPYWFAYLEPPYGVPYLRTDFASFNNVLFPNRESCEVYRWNDEFSNYFDDGKEWWGTGLWTIYDNKSGLMVVIGASLTD